MPMPVSATASSIQSRPSATLRTRNVTSPCLVNLHALLKRLSRIWRSRIGSTSGDPSAPGASRTRRVWLSSARGGGVAGRVDDEAVLVLLGEMAGGADHLVDQRSETHRLRAELELAGFDLRQVEH